MIMALDTGTYFGTVIITFLMVITFFILILAFLYVIYGRKEAVATATPKPKT
jgi:uncharacterized membrane protein